MLKAAIASAIAVGIIVAVLLLAGIAPVEAAQKLAAGAFGSPRAIAGTLKETMPLLFTGLAVFVALRAGLFNIGVEGQLLVGALACAGVALQVPGENGIYAGTAAGVVAGCVWALPAAWIKAYRGGHEVITTIMLNSVAVYFTTALAAGPLKDINEQMATTASLPAETRIPLLTSDPLDLNLGLLIGLGLALLITLWMKRTVAGFELQAAGANPTAASYAGVVVPRKQFRAMAWSGAIAGLAGAMQVLAYEGRFYEGMSPGYGFDALGVALLAGSNALGVIPGALLFGALAKGGTAIQVLGVPKGITTIVLGLIILVFAIGRARRRGHD